MPQFLLVLIFLELSSLVPTRPIPFIVEMSDKNDCIIFFCGKILFWPFEKILILKRTLKNFPILNGRN